MSKIFKVITQEQLKACLDLRHRVFVEEQGVPVELEIDELDTLGTHHIMIGDANTALATARLVKSSHGVKIQRVAVDQSQRGKGLGADLIRHLVAQAAELFPDELVILDAQTDATGFYERLGFATEGEPFDDAGIEHVRMVRRSA